MSWELKTVYRITGYIGGKEIYDEETQKEYFVAENKEELAEIVCKLSPLCIASLGDSINVKVVEMSEKRLRHIRKYDSQTTNV